MVSQITSISIVYATIFFKKQRKHQSSAHWPLLGESSGDWWIPLTKGQ